jgi:chaperonin GroEL
MQALVPSIVKKMEDYTLRVTGENYYDTLLKVATLSANGDSELGEAIIAALDTVGEEGNMTIVESAGSSKYTIERVNGYSVELGYEESCRSFNSSFINDKTGTQVIMQNPIFILFDGVINDIMQVFPALQALGGQFEASKRQDRGIVLVAHGFSDTLLGDLSFNWNSAQSTAKVFPMLSQQSAVHNSRSSFLYDLQAYTGVPVFNPVDKPIADIDAVKIIANCRATAFESGRFKSSIFASEDVEAIQIRVDELKEHLKAPESEYEQRDLEVRIGKLTSGIARLNISAPSTSETREKRDRAEDAWMAVRGAVKHGAMPGGGFVLVKLSADLFAASEKLPGSPKKMAMAILASAFLQPVHVLYKNYGYLEEEVLEQITKLIQNEDQTFDILEQKWVDKFSMLDSAPAVVEAIRNSISIASLLGTIGGIIAFKRDGDEDSKEAQLVRQFETAIGERGSLHEDKE